MIIYSITNTVNGMMYIGQTTRSLSARIHDHKSAMNNGKMSKLYIAMREYGFDKFKFSVIAETESKDVLDDLEVYYIKKFDTIRHGYNMGAGGKINVMDSEEVAQKHDATMRSDEVRTKISRSMKLSYAVRGGASETHRKHLSENKRNFYKSERGKATAKRFSETFKLSDSHKQALIGSLQKKVVCYDSSGIIIQEFDSIKSAANWWLNNGCSAKSIKSICAKIKKSNDSDSYIDGYKFVYRV